MKKRNRIIATTLALVMVLSCFSGCAKGGTGGSTKGNKHTNPDATEILITYWNAGMGREWLDNTIEAFETKYSDYYVTLVASASMNAVNASLGMADVDKTDIYMSITSAIDEEYILPLEDILESTADGDQTPIKDKMDSSFLERCKSSDGHVYSITCGGGITGIVYNMELFNEAGIKQLPRTTDELAAVCDTLYNHDITPICHFGDNGYYHYMDALFTAQYDGMDYLVNNFYACKDENGVSPSKEVLLKKDGRYYALKAWEKVITPEYVLQGSNSKTHTEIQTEFASGKAAMMVNGSWLRNEIASMGTDNIRMMQSPVLSSIVDKLSTVKNDYTLRALITAIDQVKSGEKQASDFASGENYVVDGMTVSAEDWNRVLEARYSVTSNYLAQGAYVPEYSDNIEGAKKFIQFMCSDEGLKIYYDTCQSPKPFHYSTGEKLDTGKYGEFEKQQFVIMDNAENLIEEEIASRHAIFKVGGATAYAGINYADMLSTLNTSSRMTADEIWEKVVKTIDEKYDGTWLPNIK